MWLVAAVAVSQILVRYATLLSDITSRASIRSMSMTPKEVVEIWIDRFNQTDVDGLADLYAPDAINDQVVFSEPLQGRPAIRRLFELEFF